MAIKLLRTFTMQAEALAKLQRGGEQKVRVEHDALEMKTMASPALPMPAAMVPVTAPHLERIDGSEPRTSGPGRRGGVGP